MKTASHDLIERVAERTFEAAVSPELGYREKVIAISKEAMGMVEGLSYPDGFSELLEDDIVFLNDEDTLPYIPQYINPDYEKALSKGSDFLRLSPAKNLLDAVQNLLIFYQNVPSLNSYPVSMGKVDKLLSPFVSGEKPEKVNEIIELMIKNIELTSTSPLSCLGLENKGCDISGLILSAYQKIQPSMPKIVFYHKESVSDSCLEGVLSSAISTGEAAIIKADSCDDAFYHPLCGEMKSGGGIYTMPELSLSALFEKSDSNEDFLNTRLPDAISKICGYIKTRVDFITEDCGFFESNFLATEGFLKKEEFFSAIKLFGLRETLDKLNANQLDNAEKSTSDVIVASINAIIDTELKEYPCSFVFAESSKESSFPSASVSESERAKKTVLDILKHSDSVSVRHNGKEYTISGYKGD